jgi:hypothetical protein
LLLLFIEILNLVPDIVTPRSVSSAFKLGDDALMSAVPRIWRLAYAGPA